MVHAHDFFVLRSGQFGAVDNPVIITATVETILFTQTVGKHLSFVVLFPRDLVGQFLCGWWRCCCCCRHCHPCCHCRPCRLAFLHKDDATPTARLALLVERFALVSELEDLGKGTGDSAGSCEGIIVDLILEVPMSFVAEAVEEQCGNIVALHLSCCCLVFGQVTCFSQGKRSYWSIKFIKDNLGGSRMQPGATVQWFDHVDGTLELQLVAWQGLGRWLVYKEHLLVHLY